MQVDAIRKTLGIDSMEDIELLVNTFYEFDNRAQAMMHDAMENSGEEGEDHDQSRSREYQANETESKYHSMSNISPQQKQSEIGSTSPHDRSMLGADDRLDINEDDIFNILDEFNRRRE